MKIVIKNESGGIILEGDYESMQEVFQSLKKPTEYTSMGKYLGPFAYRLSHNSEILDPTSSLLERGNGSSLEFTAKTRPEASARAIRRIEIDNSWGNIPEEFRDDPEVIIAAVRKNGNALQYASDELKNDPAVVLAALQSQHYGMDPVSPLTFASPALQENRNMVIAALRRNPNLELVSERFRDDYEIVLAAIQSGERYHSLPEELKNDENIAIAAVKNSYNFQYILEAPRNNREVVMAAVCKNGYALQYVPEALRNSEVVMAAVCENGNALQYASEELKNDHAVVLAAVQSPGSQSVVMDDFPLKFASPALQSDDKMVIAALRCNPGLEFVLEELRDDFDVVMAAVKKSPEKVCHAGNKFRSHTMHMLEIAKLDERLLRFATGKLAGQTLEQIEKGANDVEVARMIDHPSKHTLFFSKQKRPGVVRNIVGYLAYSNEVRESEKIEQPHNSQPSGPSGP